MNLNEKIKLYAYVVLAFSILLKIFFSDASHWNLPLTDMKRELDFLDCVYFATVTLFTVGYGDITPKSQVLKIFVILELFVSYYIVSLE